MKSLVVLTFFLAIVTSTPDAQTIIAQTGASSGRKITLAMKGVTLKQALDEISRQSGTPVAIGREALGSKQRIDVNVRDVSALEAVSAVVKRTGLVVRVVSTGQIMVVAGSTRAGTGEAQGSISGKVTDAKSGQVLSGATVSVTDGSTTRTDESGLYRLRSVPAATHIIAVRMVGYAKQSRTVTVEEGREVTADFKLEPSANVLDQVIVTGTVVATELKSVPNAITVITAKQIEERGITRIDELFRGEIPGLFSLETGAAGTAGAVSLDEVIMYSRGATRISETDLVASVITNPIKTYVDGVELSNSQYLSQIDPKSIERIEILTGPQASTIYGANAINGVMQIFTRRGSSARPSITLSFSEGWIQNNFTSALAPSHRIDGSISGAEGKVSYNIGSGWDYTAAWTPGKQMQRTSVYGGGKYQSGSFSLDMSARQGWTVNKVQGATSQVSTDLAQAGKFGYANNSGLIEPMKRSLYGRTLGATGGFSPFSWWSHQLNIGNDVSDTHQYGSRASYMTRGDTTYISIQNPGNRTSQSYSSTLRVPFGSLAQATVTYGGDHWRSRSGMVFWSTVPETRAISSPVVVRNKPDKNSGAFAQGQLGIGNALFFTYGVRVDWNPNYGEQARVRPGRYGVSYARDIGVVSAKLRGSYGRSIRPPGSNLIQGVPVTLINDVGTLAYYTEPGNTLYQVLPNPELGPEFQQGGEGGVELYLGSRGSIVVTRFNQTVDGLINNVTGSDSLRALEPGRPLIAGIVNCSNTSTSPSNSPRSDGYCYFMQSRYLNVGSIRNQGWEMQGSINTGPFTTRGTYSWTRSRVVGVTPKYRHLLTERAFMPGQTFSYIPEHTWAMNVSYASGGTSLSLNVNGVGQTLREADLSDLALVTSSSLRLRARDSYSFSSVLASGVIRLGQAGYTTANMNASQRLSERIETTLQITNLTNHYQNDYYYQYPTIGRQTRLGARVRW